MSDCFYKAVFFNKLSFDEINCLDHIREEKLFKKGEIISNEGDEIKQFIYMKKGLVKIHKHGLDGRERIISIAKPIDFFGLLTIFSDTQYKYSITAIEESRFCMFDVKAFKETILLNANFAMMLIGRMSQVADGIIKTRFDIGGKNLRGRIAYILMYFANDVYMNNSFELPLSRKEIAELIDMTTENVIRILSEFNKDNIIRLDGKSIEITNVELLRKINLAG